MFKQVTFLKASFFFCFSYYFYFRTQCDKQLYDNNNLYIIIIEYTWRDYFSILNVATGRRCGTAVVAVAFCALAVVITDLITPLGNGPCDGSINRLHGDCKTVGHIQSINDTTIIYNLLSVYTRGEINYISNIFYTHMNERLYTSIWVCVYVYVCFI